MCNALDGKKLLKRYARIPWEVGTDDRLTDRDVRVYFALASFVRNGPLASAGIRWIAECVHVSPRLVIDSLRSLEACGHIEAHPAANGKRREYRMLSPVFAGPAGAAAKPAASVTRCPKCSRTCRQLGREGWCRTCSGDADLERRIRAAMLTLGEKATPEEIFAHLHIEKGARRVRLLLRRMAA